MCPQSCLGDAGEDGCCLRWQDALYARLWEEALRKRDELIGEGLAPGRLHIFRVSQDEDFIATYLAVHMAGAVAVPLERDCPETRFRDLVAATATSSCHVTRTEWRR